MILVNLIFSKLLFFYLCVEEKLPLSLYKIIEKKTKKQRLWYNMQSNNWLKVRSGEVSVFPANVKNATESVSPKTGRCISS